MNHEGDYCRGVVIVAGTERRDADQIRPEISDDRDGAVVVLRCPCAGDIMLP